MYINDLTWPKGERLLPGGKYTKAAVSAQNERTVAYLPLSAASGSQRFGARGGGRLCVNHAIVLRRMAHLEERPRPTTAT